MPKGRGPISLADVHDLEVFGRPAPGKAVRPWSKAQAEAWDRRLRARPRPTVLVWRAGDLWVRSRAGTDGTWVLVWSRRPPAPGERLLTGPNRSGQARGGSQRLSDNG